MADALSRSEIESLLAAVKADAAKLPISAIQNERAENSIDALVDTESFERMRSASTNRFFESAFEAIVGRLSQLLNSRIRLTDYQTIDPGSVQKATDAEIEFELSCPGMQNWGVIFQADLTQAILAKLLATEIHGLDARPLTSIERQLFDPLLVSLAESLSDEFGMPLKLVEHTGETQSGFLAASGEIQFEDSKWGRIQILVPPETTEKASFSTTTNQVQQTQVEVNLLSSQVPAATAGGWEIGDMLMTELTPMSPIAVSIGQQPAFTGTMGIYQGRKALRISERLAE